QRGRESIRHLAVDVQLGRAAVSQYQPATSFHHIERGSNNHLVITMAQGAWRGRKDVAEAPEHAVLAADVMGRFDLIAERRSAQDKFKTFPRQQIREIGVTGWKLLDDKRALGLGKALFQPRGEPVDPQLFAGSNRRREIEIGIHECTSSAL